LFICFHSAFSQEYINGRIIDSMTGEPLPFANIVYNSRGLGNVSNIDGRFRIKYTADIEFLKFSYLGYRSEQIIIDTLITFQDLTVKLEPVSYDLNEVSVFPGINPAHRIINKAIENRDLNNPEKMRSFSYRAYNKMYFTVLYDTLKGYTRDVRSDISNVSMTDLETVGISTPSHSENDTVNRSVDTLFSKNKDRLSGRIDTSVMIMKENQFPRIDTSLDETMDFIKDKHLFLMEFVSEREFMHPDKNRETVIASRVSGLKDPSFTLLATQIQSFSFYNDLITISDKKYINPVSKGSTAKYLFMLEDTILTDRNDTIYIISFRPKRGKNFDGLKGILHINTNNYAIQDVIAEAADQEGMISVRIRQKYEWIDNQQWFPVELNTDILITLSQKKSDSLQTSLAGIGKSYLSNIKINPKLSKADFSPVELTVNDDAHLKSDDWWDQYRMIPLTAIDTNTYRIIDSIGQAAHLDRQLSIIETLASGYIPFGILDINWRNIINYNTYEGFRLGLDIQTNRKLSHWFTLGSHINWGTCDKDLKYGGHLKIYFDPVSETFIQYRYNNDVMESAGLRFLDDIPLTSSESFRKFLIRDKDIVEEHEILIGSSLLRYLRINLYLNHNSKKVTSSYRFQIDTESPSINLFHFTELGLRIRSAYKEKYVETPRGTRISVGTKWPVVNMNIIRGMQWLNGDYEYLKLEGKITKTFITKSFGNTLFTLTGGMIDRNIPYTNIYNGYGSYGVFVPEAENTFATMRMNEFVVDHFIFAFLQQDFGSLIFKKGNFRPSVVLAMHAGYGTLVHDTGHLNLELKSIEKGYYESGLLFKNLFRQWIIGYGLGVFYRYGPYSLNKTIDNFAFKFTISFNI
jgi:hypothetical protein